MIDCNDACSVISNLPALWPLFEIKLVACLIKIVEVDREACIPAGWLWCADNVVAAGWRAARVYGLFLN